MTANLAQLAEFVRSTSIAAIEPARYLPLHEPSRSDRSGGASDKTHEDDLKEAVRTAVINKRAGGIGLPSLRKRSRSRSSAVSSFCMPFKAFTCSSR